MSRTAGSTFSVNSPSQFASDTYSQIVVGSCPFRYYVDETAAFFERHTKSFHHLSTSAGECEAVRVRIGPAGHLVTAEDA